MNRNQSPEKGSQGVKAVVVVYSLELRSWVKVMEKEKERTGGRSRNHEESVYLKSIVDEDDASDATPMARLNENELVPYRAGNR